MSDADTIKEFLVKLGFKIDEGSFKKFDGAIGQTTKNVAALGLGVVAAAAATEAFVAKIASGLDKLYFASRRTGASASEISSFEYAIGQLGGTAEEALDSLEGLKKYMRENYAGGLLTQALGVDPGHLGDAKKVIDDLAKTFLKLHNNGQDPLMWMYAHQLGIGDKTTLAMLDPQFASKEHAYDEMLRQQGVDLDGIAKSGMEFSKQLDTLESSFGLLATSLGGKLIPYMSELNDWIIKILGNGIGGGKTYNSIDDWYNQRGVGGMLWDSFTQGAGMYSPDAAVGMGKNAVTGLKGMAASGHMAAFFEKHGLSDANAAALAANFMAESSGKPNAVNGSHFGLGQWDKSRQADFAAWAGHDIHSSTMDEQLGFSLFELNGKYKNVLNQITGKNPAQAADILNRMYEVSSNDPATLARNSVLRGNYANQIFNQGAGATLHMTNNVTVNGADNPADVASSVAFAVKDSGQTMVRNLNSVVQ